MKIYKFGGASVRSADGVRNLCDILSADEGEILVVVSAMGKTTNALECVTEMFVAGQTKEALGKLAEVIDYHNEIVRSLFFSAENESNSTDNDATTGIKNIFSELQNIIKDTDPAENDYDTWYDIIVSYGEILSTRIVSTYMSTRGLANRWVDMRKIFITDGRHRDANVDAELSTPLLRKEVRNMRDAGARFIVGQGFIGCAPDGEPVTLGREGSDYSAAIAGYILDAENVTIWKDVEGIMNADPKFFPNTTYIPELTYLDAVELAYSGAQIIHPKTIKPLQNKDIPLYVRPFGDYSKPGSVIKGEAESKIGVPVLILKHNQVLVSIRPQDFSFVLEDRYTEIFSLMARHNIKINLIQSSAVNLSVSVDRSRHLARLVDELGRRGFRTVYNDGLELLTVRGYTPTLCDDLEEDGDILLLQRTRRILRIVRRCAEKMR